MPPPPFVTFYKVVFKINFKSVLTFQGGKKIFFLQKCPKSGLVVKRLGLGLGTWDLGPGI